MHCRCNHNCSPSSPFQNTSFMVVPIVPWPFLDTSSPSSPKFKEPPKHQTTFAYTVNNVYKIPLSKLSIPCVKEDRLDIVILEEEYVLIVETCKHNLYGRVVWPKGSMFLTMGVLKSKLLVL